MTKTKTTATKVRVGGWVYCDNICGVHEDSLNPYDYPEKRDHCKKSDHRALYANRRKGDTPGEYL